MLAWCGSICIPSSIRGTRFGGMKGSGIGRGGSAFIDDYTELKSVMVRY